jgi:hypothetical protein
MWKLIPTRKDSRASLRAERPVDTQPPYEDQQVLLQAVKEADRNVKQAIVENAVKAADNGAAQELVTQAIEAAPHGAAKAAISESGISQETLDEIWRAIVGAFKWVLQVATVGLIAVIILDVFADVDLAHLQIMLTVFTTGAGILAGFITGQALGGSGVKGRKESNSQKW